MKNNENRRKFLKNSGLSSLALMVLALPSVVTNKLVNHDKSDTTKSKVKINEKAVVRTKKGGSK